MNQWPYHATMALTQAARTGQIAPTPAPTPEERRQNQRFIDSLAEGFRQVTPALVLTGLVIGLASGAGSTIGTALGTVFVDRFMRRRAGGRGR